MSKMKSLLIKETTQEEDDLIKNVYTGETGHIRVGVHGFLFPVKFREGLNKLHNMPVRANDVFVVSFPRSGTTWTQEMVWLISNDLDFKTSQAIPLNERYAFPEFALLFSNEQIEELRQNEEMLQVYKELKNATVECLTTASDPRYIKTHLPLSLLPPGLLETSKVVYVARDPRDVAVSFHHLCKMMNKVKPYTGNFKDFWNLLLKDLIMWSPLFEHTKNAWQMRNHRNLLFLFYEEMSKDLHSVIRKVSNFLGKTYNEEQVRALADHLNIENFRKNQAVRLTAFEENGMLDNGEKFIRKGKVGGWRDYFDEEMMQQADTWFSKNLQDTDLRFPHF